MFDSASPEMRLHLQHVVNAMVNESGGAIPREHLTQVVDDAYQEIAEHARIETFIPILTLRHARLLLDTEAYATGRKPKDFIGVLIICKRNRGRSQVAAALFRFYAPGLVTVQSAGLDPALQPRDAVVSYLRERGVELTDYPKKVRPRYIDLADHIIFLGNSSEIDLPADKDVEYWEIGHYGESATFDHIAATTREIDQHVRATISRILPDHQMPPSIFESRV